VQDVLWVRSYESPLSVAEMEGFFAELASLGSFRLALTGGEPLLRKDVFDILDAATGHGLHPRLTTNGLLVDDHLAREIGKRHPDGPPSNEKP
jgi:MoaA/NifB/PqqE/SkfB family radical SAM enzyme